MTKLRLIALIAGFVFFATYEAFAQSIVLNGLYDCQRATNGRPYCKRQGALNNQYEPVTEDFFASYDAARTGKAVNPTVVIAPKEVNNTNVTNNQTVNNTIIIQIKADAVDVKGQIAVLTAVVDEQKKLLSSSGDSAVISETITSIEERITELKSSFEEKANTLATKYATPIKPDDADLVITARKASEIYPKVPYYIVGTPETGEFWIEPVVSDTGALIFKFKFVDVKSTAAEKVRSTIEMKPDELEKIQKAFVKLAANSKMAHDKKIRRKLDVRLECFPAADCPPEGQKVDAKASTEILFSINEDGSTSGRIQRNKGRFEEGYNVSVKSGLILQAYIHHVLSEGKAEFEAGTASTEDLKKLFQ
jgi:hypothetical protein